MSATATDERVSKLRDAESYVHEALRHFESGADRWAWAFLREAERAIAEARALSEPSGGVA